MTKRRDKRSNGEERLQKILASAGYGSRRGCEDLIEQGRVRVNGEVAQLGAKANPDRDTITVDGKPIREEERPVTVALYKPEGVLSDEGDPTGTRTTVLDLVPIEEHVFPVGRLDLDSAGLVLLTNDGDLAYVLTHPRFEHEKEYHVDVTGHPGRETLEKWREGVFLAGRTTKPAQVSVLRHEKGHTWLQIVLEEGRKRQIRRVAAMLGHPVRELIRVRIGPVRLGGLEPGEWRYLSKAEIGALRNLKRQLNH